jgi:anti-anti-sigma factor
VNITNIVKDYNGKELTMTVEGRIDTITSQDLEKEINEEIGSFDSLIMNFEKVEYVSSSGLRLLISTQKKLKEENIPFAIKNVGDAVNEIFKMSGFDKIFNIE